MKIGVVGTIWLNTPPKTYGGTEEVVFNLVNGLVDKGHEVTFFGPKTAKVKSKVYPTVDKPLREQNITWTNLPYSLYHITEAFDHASDFDIIHVHLNKSQDYIALPLAKLSKTPVVFTLHFKPPTLAEHEDKYKVLNKYASLPFTSISNSQRKDIPLNFIKTVYNGIDMQYFPFVKEPEDYLVWIGKVNPLKGTKEAILAAKKAGVKLLVLGVVDEGIPSMFSYYKKEIMPLIDNEGIVWKGEVDLKEKAKIMGRAKGFLNPICWEEPFGLVMTEAQAVGTPVISFNRGAAPEVIVDGKTGFLVDTLDQMVKKINLLGSLNRQDCRKNIEDNFAVDKMIAGYEEAYGMAIDGWEGIGKIYN